MTDREKHFAEAFAIVKAVAEHSAPCWCKEDEATGEVTTCDCCNMLENIADALKAAGEGR